MLMVMADGKAIMYSSWMLHKTCGIIVQMLHHVVHIVP